MRWLTGVSLNPTLVLLCLVLAAGWRAALADGAPAAPASLAAALAALGERANARVGVSVVHVESGQEVAVGGDTSLPLYSVFKLPLAVVVLKYVERGQLRLDQEAIVDAGDVAPGVASNTEKWRHLPVAVSVQQLLEYSLIDSDNTASDELLALVGGPAELTHQIRALGFSDIDIRASTKEAAAATRHPNRGSASGLARLLSALQRGVVLRPAERAILWDSLARSQTGKQRLRGSLPAGTPVVDKTGSGRAGSATNDVGLLTLPGERGHLAIAVLITGSTRPVMEQERIIADIGRTAFEAYATSR
jgi:beta-lactamase class A